MSRLFIVPHGTKGQVVYLPDKEFRSPSSQPFGWGRTISSSNPKALSNFSSNLFQLRSVTRVHPHGDLDYFQQTIKFQMLTAFHHCQDALEANEIHLLFGFEWVAKEEIANFLEPFQIANSVSVSLIMVVPDNSTPEEAL